MAEVRLQAFKRSETGKGGARRSRAAGKVPAVVYGKGMDPLSIEVNRREFVTALHTDAGMNVLLDLEIDGKTTLALTKELQRDPVRGTLLHADFIKIDRSQKVDVDIPLHLVGESPGQKEGGVLQHPLTQLHVRSLVTAVPESIEADISGLNMGETLRVGDLPVSEDYEILTDPEEVIASVTAPISEAELEALEAGVTEEAEELEAVGEAEAGEGEAPPAETPDEAPSDEAPSE